MDPSFVESLRVALTVAMALFFAALIGFNVYMVRTYKKRAQGAVMPTAVVVIRVINAILLLAAGAIVVSALAKR
ncbi:MAG: hypothetical protein N3B11_01785 [Coriobacteriia bacterium]|nr:hypothetical protein [Coriobacteriia bacterium]